jgi:hypothetical protein
MFATFFYFLFFIFLIPLIGFIENFLLNYYNNKLLDLNYFEEKNQNNPYYDMDYYSERFENFQSWAIKNNI